MSESISVNINDSKAEKYQALLPQIKSLLEGETDLTANLANISSSLYFSMDFFWVGFYIVRGNEMVLGPFHGPVACTRIRKGRGVCGTSWEQKQCIIVPDVEKFPGHIACSSLSKSEIVIPILKDNQVVAVLDVDSEFENFFDDDDKIYLEKMCKDISHLF